jgi:adenosylcobinamide kinase/adenosylcobinamide-phosphate guanylyltransferase
MRVQVLGTGSADGWPNAFCICASCAAARREGNVRGQTGALVDDELLIDCGPEITAAASRHGAELSGVRTLLFTHGHPDHVGPAALLFRHWAHRNEALDVYGPVAVLEQLRHWVAPQDRVHFHPVSAGDRFETAGHRVTALAATHGDEAIGEALLYDITGRSGHRLFYATDTGPLSDRAVDAVRSARFDLVLLEETFGDHLTHDGDHLDLETFPDQLRRLREVDAIADNTDVVAVHLSHHNPPTAQLKQRLRAWGARVVPDGTTLAVGSTTPLTPTTVEFPRRTLVIGGARSGKSRHAESLLAAAERVTYVATADRRPNDEEWVARIEAHQRRRPLPP